MTGVTRADDGALSSVLEALNDPTCRDVLECLEEPTGAEELAECCGVSSSTIYRKLKTLQGAGLVERRYLIKADYSQTTRYATTFDEISISLDDVRMATLRSEGD